MMYDLPPFIGVHMFTLSDMACWYLVLSILFSGYQAYRGFMFQWILANKEQWTMPQRVILLCFSDMIFYLLCTLAGFASFFMVYHIYTQGLVFLQLQVGTAMLLIFLILFGILGVTGQLPHLLQQGKFPWTSKT